MIKVVIVSDDYCIINRIINIVQKTNKRIAIQIYNPKDFQTQKTNDSLKGAIYLMDIYSLKNNFLEVLRELKKRDQTSKVIMISMDRKITSLLESQLMVDICIEKCYNFEQNLRESLFHLLKNKETNIQVSESNISIQLSRKDFENTFYFPNNQISIHYKNGKNTIMISFDKTTNAFKELSKKNFYREKAKWNETKRKQYIDPVKQIIVDLYSVAQKEGYDAFDPFQVDIKNIKRWSNLTKYNQRCYLLRYIMAKLILKFYFKK